MSKKIGIIEVVGGAIAAGVIYEVVKSFTPDIHTGPIPPDTSTVTLPKNNNPVFQTVVPSLTTWAANMARQVDTAPANQSPDLNPADYTIPMQGITSLQDFIAKTRSLVEGNPLGIRPEVVYAQAKLESSDNSGNFGAVPQAAEANNYFGIVADRNWTGDVYTPTDGSGPFRSYASLEDGINDYFRFLRPYGITATDTAGQIQQIASKGYGGANSASYANTLNQVARQVSQIYTPGGSDKTAGMGGVVGILVLAGLAGALVVGTRKRKGISGVGDWIKDNPYKVAGAVGILVLVGGAYYAGKKGQDDQGGTQDLQVTTAQLPDPTGAKYKIAADNIYTDMNDNALPDTDSIIATLQPMTTDELKAVVKAFGTRAPNHLGINTSSAKNLFQWFELEYMGEDARTELKNIFAPTGLWS
jgi:hypothetical protein